MPHVLRDVRFGQAVSDACAALQGRAEVVVAYPIRAPPARREACRAPLAIAADGSVTMASSLPVGQIVRVVQATPAQLLTAAETLSTRVSDRIGATLRGALVFDCAARRNVLGDRYPEHTRAFTAGRASPTVGVTSYGEVAKFGGSVDAFHNTTSVMVGW